MMGTVLRYSLARMFASLLVLVKLGHERPHMPDLIRLRNDNTLQVRVIGRQFLDLGSC